MMLNPHVFLYFAHAHTEVTTSVFGVPDEMRLKPVSIATWTSKKIEISLEVRLDMEFLKKRQNVLISLLHCCCYQIPKDRFSRVEAHISVGEAARL